jgi:hypothetical protein
MAHDLMEDVSKISFLSFLKAQKERGAPIVKLCMTIFGSPNQHS